MRNAPRTRTISDLLNDPRPIAGGDPSADEVSELLTRVGDAEQRAVMTDDELSAAVTTLREHAASLAESTSEEDLDTLDSIATAVTETIPAEQDTRAEAATALDARRTAALDRINAEPVAETDPTPADPPAEDPPAEPVADPATDPAPTDPPAEPAGDPAAEPQAVAAAATPPAPARRQPPGAARPATPARVEVVRERPVLVAASGQPGVQSGTTYENLVAAAELFIDRHRSFMGRGNDEKVPVISMFNEYPEDRRLDHENSLSQNSAIVAAAVGPERVLEAHEAGEALIAAGGFCAPSTISYDVAGISTAERPVRDSLPGFGTTRGGLRFAEPNVFSDMEDAISIWTETDDIDALDDEDVRKACLRVECGEFDEKRLEAVVACLTFGNLAARAWPENVAAKLADVLAIQARVGDARLIRKIDEESVKVNYSQVVGASRDILFAIAQQAAGIRYRNRTPRNFPVRVILPAYVLDMIRDDLMRQHPGDNAFSVAEAEINGYFTARNINVTWALDVHPSTGAGFATQGFAPQTDGPPKVYPTEVLAFVYPEGSHLFLDGGELDLGMVRDSTLNARNDYQLFSESFENLAFVGLESQRLKIAVCADGSTSAPVDVICGATGS